MEEGSKGECEGHPDVTYLDAIGVRARYLKRGFSSFENRERRSEMLLAGF
jgi:hypothetical protein